MNIPALPKELKDPPVLLRALHTKPESYWIKRGEKRALQLFHLMARRVPAYKDFLKKHKIDPHKIKTIADFKNIPTIDKKNYLHKYPLPDLCWDGNLTGKWINYSSTSGSTGIPFYFPRNNDQDQQYAAVAEMYLRNNFDIHRKKTLYINCFAMGVWIGGLFTYKAIEIVAERGKYPLNIINPGLQKEEIFKAILRLGKFYEQIIIGGYPPFIKDVVDEGVWEGIQWGKYRVKFVFSAEGFSEEFRDYIINKARLKNPYTDTLNHYGIVDLGTASHETPQSILLRRLARQNPALASGLFLEPNKTPTLTQYIPELFYFEIVGPKSILCSAFSGIPLVRYDVKDNGGIIHSADIDKVCRNSDINLKNVIQVTGIQHTILKVPFLYVYERSDFVISLFGSNIYPESIRKALQQKNLSTRCTGKFTMIVRRDRYQNPYFELNVELKRNTKQLRPLAQKIADAVVQVLLKENSEYKSNYLHMPRRMVPRVVLWPYGDSKYFSGKGKQKWVVK